MNPEAIAFAVGVCLGAFIVAAGMALARMT